LDNRVPNRDSLLTTRLLVTTGPQVGGDCNNDVGNPAPYL
jgi:hypothetical protein